LRAAVAPVVLRATPVRAAPRDIGGAVADGAVDPAGAPVAAAASGPEARGDFNGDLVVNRRDLAILASNFGRSGDASPADGDLSGDGTVSLADVARVVLSAPQLRVTVAASVASVAAAGSVVNYTYTVENSGNSTLSGVTLSSDRGPAPVRLADAVGDNDDSLDYGETWRYGNSYTVSQADLDMHADVVVQATADSVQSEPHSATAAVYNLFPATDTLLGGGAAGIPSTHQVAIRAINHASFVMTANGRTIYVDPVGGASLYASFPRADLVLVTHSHGDHYSSSTIGGVIDTSTTDGDGVVQILAPQAVFSSMSATLRGY
jgi:hypothetical protein